MRIDKYEQGATAGQIKKFLMEKDYEAYIKGDFDDVFLKLLEKSLFLSKSGLIMVAEHPVLGQWLDDTLKCPKK